MLIFALFFPFSNMPLSDGIDFLRKPRNFQSDARGPVSEALVTTPLHMGDRLLDHMGD